jgi:hypothetical protein
LGFGLGMPRATGEGMLSLVTKSGRTFRNSRTGALLTGLELCETAAIAESRNRSLPAGRAAREQIAVGTFADAFRRMFVL